MESVELDTCQNRYIAAGRVKIIICLLTISAFVSLLYFPALSGGFIFDDYTNIVDNEYIRIDNLSFKSFFSSFGAGIAGEIGRPISALTFALNYYFNGLDPYGYKLVNLFIHCLNAALLFAIIFLLLNKNQKSHMKYIVPLVLSLVWAVHPLNVSSVMYIVQRMNLLSAFFSLLGVFGYLYGRITLNGGVAGVVVSTLAVFLCMGLGFLCKENAVLLPLFVILIDRCLLDSGNRLFERVMLWVYILPTILASIYAIINPERLLEGYSIRQFDAYQRLLTQFRVLVGYIYNLLFPSLNNLTFFKDNIHHSVDILNPSSTIFCMITVLALLVFAVLFRKRYRLLSFSIIFFFLGHLIESSALPLELAFEHRNYVPSMSIGIVFFSAAWWIIKLTKINELVVYLAILISLGGLCFFRCLEWGDPVLLAKAEAARAPLSMRANLAAGDVYADAYKNAQDEKYKDIAHDYFDKASKAKAEDCSPYIAQIMLNAVANKKTDDKVYEKFIRGLSNYPVEVYNPHYVNQLINLSVIDGYAVPAHFLQQAVSALGESSKGQRNEYQSRVMTVKASYHYNITKDYNVAVEAAKEAVVLLPSSFKSHYNLLKMLVEIRELKQAEEVVEIMHEKFSSRSKIYNINSMLETKSNN